MFSIKLKTYTSIKQYTLKKAQVPASVALLSQLCLCNQAL